MLEFNEILSDFKGKIEYLAKRIEFLKKASFDQYENYLKNFYSIKPMKKAIIENLIKNNTKFEQYPEDIKEIMSEFWEKLIFIASISSFLDEQTIITAYSNYEHFLRKLCEEYYFYFPSELNTDTIKYETILELGSISEITDYLINKKLKELWGNIDEIQKEAIKLFNIKIKDIDTYSKIIKKIVSIRNQLVHQTGEIDREFLEKNPEYFFKIGENKFNDLNLTIGTKIQLKNGELKDFIDTILKLSSLIVEKLNEKLKSRKIIE
ncbi:MAG: hypothetical protein HeimC3_32470 [Candidatus Heimdallarchaeota archaeon LC_3]|nr:MAG: hypothetical protein HeimC3_32470 [Candidatus Heimdallarchaeota archaeon LC_3]